MKIRFVFWVLLASLISPGFTEAGDEINLAQVDSNENLIEKKLTRHREVVEKLELLLAQQPAHENAPAWHHRVAETLYDIARMEYLQARQADGPNAIRAPAFGPVIERYKLILNQYSDYERGDEVSYLLGTMLMEQGNKKDGVDELKRAIKNYPDSAFADAILLGLAEHYFDQQNLHRALEHYRALVENYPASKVYAYALYKKGWVHYNFGDIKNFDEARLCFQGVIKHAEDAYSACVAEREKTKGTRNCEGERGLRGQALNDLIFVFAELPGGWRSFRAYAKTLLDRDTLQKKSETFGHLLIDRGLHNEVIALYHALSLEDHLAAHLPDYARRIIRAYLELGDVSAAAAAANTFAVQFKPGGDWRKANLSDGEAIESSVVVIEASKSSTALRAITEP